MDQAAVLDNNFVSRKVLLSPWSRLNMERITLANFHSGFIRLAFRIDLIAPVPAPAPGMGRPSVYMHGGSVLLRVCFSQRLQQMANTGLRRAPEVPGVQAMGSEHVQDAGCRNTSAAPVFERCWGGLFNYTSVVLEAQYLDTVGNAMPANYLINLNNTLLMCKAVVKDECLAQQTALGCWAALDAQLQKQEAAEQEAAQQEEAQQSGGGDDDGVPLYIVVPAVVGGVAVLALAGFVAYRWRAHRRAGGGSSSKGKSSPASQSTHTSHEATGTHHAPAAQPTSTVTVSVMDTHASRMSAGSAPPTSRNARTPRAVPLHDPGGVRPCQGLVTPTSPLMAIIRLDLRIGPDLVVHQDAMRGAGAYARVLEGDFQGQRVAVKLFHASQQLRSAAGTGGTASGIGGIRSEVEVLSRCSHRNIVALLGACTEPPHVFLVMELLEQSLEQLMDHHTQLLPLDQALQIAMDMAQGLAYLHPTVTHRDLKPANVLLDEHGTAKLSDFGLARLHDTVRETCHPEAGTAPYTAPECFDPNNSTVTHKADIYSWAVVVWEMLAGKAPWEGLQPLAIAFAVTFSHARLPLTRLPPERCPPRLRDLVFECWDKDPQRRPSAEEVVKRLSLIQMRILQSASTIPNVSASNVLPPQDSSLSGAACGSGAWGAGAHEAASLGGDAPRVLQAQSLERSRQASPTDTASALLQQQERLLRKPAPASAPGYGKGGGRMNSAADADDADIDSARLPAARSMQ